MRRLVILVTRCIVVLLLIAAALGISIPSKSRDRVRIHLVDRSASVSIKGPEESLTLRDADAIVAADRAAKTGGDDIQWGSFGRTVVFDSKQVDGSSTDLAGALAAALGRNPTEIVLHTDARADPGTALFLCRDRNIPVHVFPLGPTSVRDARITRISAPAEARSDETFAIEVTVESTFDGPVDVSLDGDTREVTLVRGVPTVVTFPNRKGGPFTAALRVEDACRENNRAQGEVFERSEKRRILVLSNAPFNLPEYAVAPEGAFAGFAAVVLGRALPPEDQTALAAYVKGGGGLLLLGEKGAFSEANWKGNAIEEISPVRMLPDQRVAVVFGIDSSGSMNKDDRIDSVIRIVQATARYFDADDTVFGMTFANEARIIRNLGDLRRIHATGGTNIHKGIEKAREELKPLKAGRKHVVLLTDGESAAGDTPELIKAQIDLLDDIGLLVVTTNRKVPHAANIEITDGTKLQERLEDIVRGIKDTTKERPGTVEYRKHPLVDGLPALNPARIFRTAAKSQTTVVASVGKAPAQDPAVAFWPVGFGRVGAVLFPFEAAAAPLLGRAIEHVAGEKAAGLSLSIDPPILRATGTGPSKLKATLQIGTDSREVILDQVSSSTWEGLLPTEATGSISVRCRGALATATIPDTELAALGLDRAALERIAGDTRGRVLASPAELTALPRPDTRLPRSGRPFFLAAALVAFLLEMALATFWKA